MSGAWYQWLARPLLFRLEPEVAHGVAMAALRAVPPAVLSRLSGAGRSPGPAREVFGVRFPNPVGLAAGFDKNAEALPGWAALGFGFVEVGTITAKGQPGNPKPRVFRLPAQRALINRMGFNNDGAEAVAGRLRALKESGRWPPMPVGINIGKSRVTPVEEAAADYAASFRALREFADYFALNVSSPNTPGLRSLQGRGALEGLLRAVQEENASGGRRVPVLVKIAPDLSFGQIEEIIGIAEAAGVSGLIATNTTLDHSTVPEGLRTDGGLSGAPLRARATEIVRFIRSRSAMPIVAAGGVMDASSAAEKLDAGAELVQVYTGFIYRGPALLREIRERAAA